ncbi:MAG: hypothetical protein ACI8ZM_000167 [Crocinitomix sp.]|jgi:hypothetical protein
MLTIRFRLSALIITLFISFSGTTQPPFVKFFGDSIKCNSKSLIPFQDTSLFHVGGISVPGPAIADSYFAMTDSVGNVAWARRYNFGANELVQDVATDDSHLYVLTFASNVYHSHVIKIAPNGSTVWSYRFLGEFAETVLKKILIVDDGIMCVGWVRPSGYLSEIAVVKLDFDGNILWSSRYTPDFEPACEDPFGLIQTSNGDFVITGRTNSFGIGTPTEWGVMHTGYMMRIGNTGEFIWSKGFRYTRLVRDAIETNTNDIVAIDGDFYDFLPIVYKITAEGDVQWVKKIDQDDDIETLRIYDLIETADNNYLLFGASDYGLEYLPVFLKMAPDGTILWHKEQNIGLEYGVGSDVYQTHDKGFIADITVKFGDHQLLGTLKTDSMGNASCAEELLSLEMVDWEDLIIVDLHFDRHSFEYGKSLSNTGFFIDIDTSGFLCCDSIIAEMFYENEGYAYTFNATPDSPANYWWVINGDTLSGHTVHYSFLGPGEYTICQYADNICSQDSICETIEVLLDDSGLLEGSISKGMSIYPVPSSDHIVIKLVNTTKGTMRIFDFAGKLVYENIEFYGEEKIDLREFRKGVYFVSVLTENQGVYKGKIIKI